MHIVGAAPLNAVIARMAQDTKNVHCHGPLGDEDLAKIFNESGYICFSL